jgi:hypothetical protein
VRALDDAVLAALGAIPNLTTYDTFVPPDPDSPKVITVDLPYLCCSFGASLEGRPLMDGSNRLSEVEFDVMFVGEDRQQAKAAGERAETALWRKRLTVASKPTGLVHKTASLKVGIEPVFTRPGGFPLFYGVDRYAVVI